MFHGVRAAVGISKARWGIGLQMHVSWTDSSFCFCSGQSFRSKRHTRYKTFRYYTTVCIIATLVCEEENLRSCSTFTSTEFSDSILVFDGLVVHDKIQETVEKKVELKNVVDMLLRILRGQWNSKAQVSFFTTNPSILLYHLIQYFRMALWFTETSACTALLL